MSEHVNNRQILYGLIIVKICTRALICHPEGYIIIKNIYKLQEVGSHLLGYCEKSMASYFVTITPFSEIPICESISNSC